MKTLLLILLSISSFAQVADSTQIVVNLSDNAVLQFKGSAVKMKATVIDYRPMINGSKDFYIAVKIQMYENVSGAYGNKITDTILNDGTLSNDQKASLIQIYGDRPFDYHTIGKYVNTNGDVVPKATPGAIKEMAYWQQFKLNQISGMGSLTTQGAIDAEYKILTAIVAKMNTRKSW